MKKGICALMVASFLGSAFLKIDMFFFHITLFKVAFLICFCLAALDIMKKPRCKGNKSYYFYFLFFGVWAVENAISLIWVKDYTAWVKYTYYVLMFVFFLYLFQRYFRSEKEYAIPYTILVSIVALLNALGWFEVLTGKRLSSDIKPYVAEVAIRHRKPIVFMWNPNDFGLVMMIGFFLVYMLKMEKKCNRIVCIMLQGSCVLLLFLTESRSALLGLMSGICGIYAIKFFHEQKKRGYILFFGSASIVLISGLIAMGKIAFIAFDFSQKSLNSESIRINLIKNGVHFLKHTFGLGVGGGNYEYWVQNYSLYNTGMQTNMHNWWMEILVCYGVLIFLLYCIFYIKILKFFYFRYRESSERNLKRRYLGILGFMMAFVIGSMGSSSLFNSLHIWCIWALVVSYSLFLKRDQSYKERIA